MDSTNSQGQVGAGIHTPQQTHTAARSGAPVEEDWVWVSKSVDSDTVRASTVKFGVDFSDTGGGGGSSAALVHGNVDLLTAQVAAWAVGDGRQHPASPIQAQPHSPQPYIPFEGGKVVLSGSGVLEDGQGTATVPSNPNDSVSVAKGNGQTTARQPAHTQLALFAPLLFPLQQRPSVLTLFDDDDPMDLN